MQKTEFRKATLVKRYELLKRDGTHLASREFGGHWVHLFSVYDFHAEVWVVIGLNQIRWIEVQDNESQINLYVDKVDISHIFS